jgi:hypothetical protein
MPHRLTVTNAQRSPLPQVGAKTCESSVHVVEGAMQPARRKDVSHSRSGQSGIVI